MKELKEMRKHFDSDFSLLERQRIIELYRRVCNKEVTNIACSNCYKDAFIEINATLNRLGTLPEERHYKLKEGKCLHIFGTSEYLFDVTDEQAEKFLYQFPGAIEDFEDYPSDWESRIANRKSRSDARKVSQAKRAARKAVEESNKEE